MRFVYKQPVNPQLFKGYDVIAFFCVKQFGKPRFKVLFRLFKLFY